MNDSSTLTSFISQRHQLEERRQVTSCKNLDINCNQLDAKKLDANPSQLEANKERRASDTIGFQEKETSQKNLEKFINLSNCIRRSQSMTMNRRSSISVPRYRSGSSSDSAITLDNVFEEDDDARVPLSPGLESSLSQQSNLSKSWTPNFGVSQSGVAHNSVHISNSFQINNSVTINAKCNHLSLTEDFQEVVFNCICFILENAETPTGLISNRRQDFLNSVNFDRIMMTIKRYHNYDHLDGVQRLDKVERLEKIEECGSGSRMSKFIKLSAKRNEDAKCSKFEKISNDADQENASKIKFLEQVLTELLNIKATKCWSVDVQNGVDGNSALMTVDPWPRPFQTIDQLKILTRDGGIPKELRPKLWFSLIKNKLNDHFDAHELLAAARVTRDKYSSDKKFKGSFDHLNTISDASITTSVKNGDANERPDASERPDANERSEAIESIIRQIDLDVHRTMPGHEMFSSPEGITKLRTILIAYSVHVNPLIGYCQAMNFIAALFLIIFEGNEIQSLMALICVIDHYFPPHYYDHQLTGARADQLLLRDIIISRLLKNSICHPYGGHRNSVRSFGVRTPNVTRTASSISLPTNMASDQTIEELIDEITNSLTLNWFLSLFHQALPLQTRLQILDCFLIEGVKVLFRFSVALIELEESKLQKLISKQEEVSTGDVINTIRYRARACFDVINLKQIAFSIKLIRRKQLATRRAFYSKQLKSDHQVTLKLTASQSLPSSPIKKSDAKSNLAPQSKSASQNLKSASIKLASENQHHRTESTSDWIRRRSSELFGLASLNSSKVATPGASIIKVVQSEDASKLVLLYKNETDATNYWRLLNGVGSLNNYQTLNGNFSTEFMEIIDLSPDGCRYGRDEELASDDLMSNRMRIKNPVRGLKLVGVSNSGKRLIFYESAKDKIISNADAEVSVSSSVQSSSVYYPRIESFSLSGVSFQVIIFNGIEIYDCYYLEPIETLIGVGRRGQIFKIDLIGQQDRGPFHHQNSDSINLSSNHRKVKVVSASIDSNAGYIWINALASSRYHEEDSAEEGLIKNYQNLGPKKKNKHYQQQLIILEIRNLDVYNLIELAPISKTELASQKWRRIVSAAGIAFMVDQIDNQAAVTKSPLGEKSSSAGVSSLPPIFSVTTVISILTPTSFIRTLLVVEDELIDMKAVVCNENTVHKKLNGHSIAKRLNNSKDAKIDRRPTPKIVFVALFKSGRIDCIQMTGCYHVHSQKTLNVFHQTKTGFPNEKILNEKISNEKISNEKIPNEKIPKAEISTDAKIIDIQIVSKSSASSSLSSLSSLSPSSSPTPSVSTLAFPSHAQVAPPVFSSPSSCKEIFVTIFSTTNNHQIFSVYF